MPLITKDAVSHTRRPEAEPALLGPEAGPPSWGLCLPVSRWAWALEVLGARLRLDAGWGWPLVTEVPADGRALE